MISNMNLAKLSEELGIPVLNMEQQRGLTTFAQLNEKTKADFTEAILGALYLDGGMKSYADCPCGLDVGDGFLHKYLYGPNNGWKHQEPDAKGCFQHFIQTAFVTPPFYIPIMQPLHHAITQLIQRLQHSGLTASELDEIEMLLRSTEHAEHVHVAGLYLYETDPHPFLVCGGRTLFKAEKACALAGIQLFSGMLVTDPARFTRMMAVHRPT